MQEAKEEVVLPKKEELIQYPAFLDHLPEEIKKMFPFFGNQVDKKLKEGK